MNKNPIQTENTRSNLKRAYYSLLSSKEKLTVDRVTEKAGYMRWITGMIFALSGIWSGYLTGSAESMESSL